MLKTVRDGKNSVSLKVCKIESIVKHLKKDLLRLPGELNKKQQTI